jgi:ribonuclease Y
MHDAMVGAGGAVGGLVVGAALVYLYFSRVQKATGRQREEVLAQARTEADGLKTEAREEARKLRAEAQQESAERERSLKQHERDLDKREASLERQAEDYQGKERSLEQRLKDIDRRQAALAEQKKALDLAVDEQKQALMKISGLSRDEAVKMILARIDEELEHEKADRIRKSTVWVKEHLSEECTRLIGMAIQRFAAEHTAAAAVTVVDLPNDEMKGRIIGREGRNIRSFERATGVDVIVDDTPGVVVLSAFDGVRREMSRRAMAKLIEDGRIHPTRIEELVEQAKRDMEEEINKIGRQFLQDEEILHVHPKLVTLTGRLKFRTSYGQNVLQHIKEVGHLCGVMAAELGLDQKLARRCGIFHDVGKAVDQEFEGSHPVIGAELLRRFGEGKEVIDAAENHHSDPDAKFPYTILAATADAISASRPGARGESLERYVKRLEKLEEIAKSFAGIETAYAIQAGRELRVIADAAQVNDDRAVILAREIANEIEKQLTYPGEIRVTLTREKRVVEFAR